MKTLIIFIFFFPFILFAQDKVFFSKQSRTNRLLHDVSLLANDSLCGRYGGSEYEFRAGNYIVSQFDSCKLCKLEGLDSYRQRFLIYESIDSTNDTTKIYSNNILGYINNEAPYTIVIGAHYDHIGINYKKKTDSINNGADDNASGTAAVLEMARYLSAGHSKKYNYILACWGSEEQGLLGSNYFCSSNLFDFEKIACYINFDMIGRLGWKKKQLDVFGVGTSSVWDSVFAENKIEEFSIKKFAGAVEASDHSCFYKNKIPFIYFTSGLPPIYHTPKDETYLINPEGMELIISTAETIISRLDGNKPDYRLVSQKEMNKVYLYFLGQFFN